MVVVVVTKWRQNSIETRRILTDYDQRIARLVVFVLFAQLVEHVVEKSLGYVGRVFARLGRCHTSFDHIGQPLHCVLEVVGGRQLYIVLFELNAQ